MKLTPYRKVLKMAKEAKEALLAPIRATQMKKQGEIEVAKMDEKIVTQQAKIEELSSAYPVDFNKIIDALDELALMERRKKQFEQILKDMFGEEEE